MKTGFICASGFNLVATATRDNKRLIAIVLGAPSSSVRAVKTAQLLERGFNAGPLAWLSLTYGRVDSLTPVNTAPPNMRDEMCGKHRKRPASEDEEDPVATNAPADSPYAVFLSSLRAPKGKAADLLQDVRVGEPVVVFTGPPKDAQLAGVDSKSAKPGKKGAGPSIASANSVPWTNFSPASLAHNPPAANDSKAAPAESAISRSVPMPRARPRIAAQRPPAAPAPKSAQPARQKPAPKAAPKS
jgi:D-alanyl-D-alanine carboxypeptidase